MLLNISSKADTRDSNMELARIVAMIMILVWHFICHGIYFDKFPSAETILSFEDLGRENGILLFVSIMMMPATTVFVLISGYYKIKLTWKSFVSFWLLCFFYNLVRVLFSGEIHVSAIIRSFFISCSFHWFIKAYFWLLLISPLLNTVIEAYDVHRMRWVAVIGFILCGVSGWFFGNNTDGYNVTYLSYAYILGAYLRKENCFCNVSGEKWLLLYFITICVEYVVVMLFFCLLHKNFNYHYHCCPFVIVAACCLFLSFRSLSFHSRYINVWASTMIALLLLTDDCFHVRLYNYIHRVYESGNEFVLLTLIGVAIVAIISSAIIELVRKSVAEPISNSISQYLYNFQNKIIQKQR